MNPITWGTDVPVSMPEARDPQSSDVDLGGGYVFTDLGMRHKLSQTDAEVFYQPAFAPIPSKEGAS